MGKTQIALKFTELNERRYLKSGFELVFKCHHADAEVLDFIFFGLMLQIPSLSIRVTNR